MIGVERNLKQVKRSFDASEIVQLRYRIPVERTRVETERERLRLSSLVRTELRKILLQTILAENLTEQVTRGKFTP